MLASLLLGTSGVGSPYAGAACTRFLRLVPTLGGCLSQITRLQSSATPPVPTAEVGRLNHVAIAVPDLLQAAQRYREVLGAKVSQPQELPEHGVTVVFVELPNCKLELLAPLGSNSPISNFLARNPAGGVHHLCLEVADVRASLQAITPSMRVLDPVPKIGAHGNPVVFLHPKSNDGVLTELEEVGPRS